jgi:hypothetical protein
MKVKCTGTNHWGPHEVYLHARLAELKLPTPFTSQNIHKQQINSRMFGEDYPEKIIELQRGDYIMLLLDQDIKNHKYACGHMHYFNGRALVSVYSRKKYRGPRLD